VHFTYEKTCSRLQYEWLARFAKQVIMYNHISQFEPLLPASSKRDGLLEKAHHLQRLALAAKGRAHTSVMLAIAPLLRAMNSYYTNRIEGQHTLPVEIEQALRLDFAPDADTRRRQRLAVAHMHTEAWAEQHTAQTLWPLLFKPEVIRVLHQHLFEQLPATDRHGEQGDVLAPGEWRTREVSVGGHVAPRAKAVPLFLARFAEVYGQTRVGELAIVAVAAAHHRLTWVHPFTDGNGRVARLHSQVLLQGLGLTNGVWSPLRGLARSQPRYYEMLANADLPRRNDLDGRGHLSEEGLVAFCDYFLDICIDQAAFMTQLLDMQTMKDRIAACLAFESHREGSAIRMEALTPMHYLFLGGPMERGAFKAMTGLAPRSADRVLQALLARELLVSDKPKGAIRFGVPLHALRFYFPALWPEAEAGSHS
jgi:Fic family protein